MKTTDSLKYQEHEAVPDTGAQINAQFSRSTFDILSQPLPTMPRKPQKLHTVDAISYVAHSPVPVPHHWKEGIKKQLEKDIETGVLQKVPVGQPTEWCIQMVVVAKKDEK